MTRMIACFNQESELKKERVREGTRAQMLGPGMIHGHATRKNQIKWPIGYGPNLGIDLKSADDPRERNETSSPACPK